MKLINFLSVRNTLLLISAAAFNLCARHGASLTGESPVTGIYRQV